MIIGLALIVFAAIVIAIGTKPSEAVVLYYDAVDITPEMEKSGIGPEEMADVDVGAQPAAVEEPVIETPAPRVKVTVGGAEVNATQTKARTKVKEKPVETLDDIRVAAATHDPNASKTAQQIFDEIKRGKI